MVNMIATYRENHSFQKTVGKPARPIYSSDFIFCLRLPEANSPAKLVVYILLVFGFFIVYGFLQELIFRLKGFQPYGMYLTLYEFLCFSLFSSFDRWLKREGGRKIPLGLYVILAALTVGTIGFSNTSVGYLNYPTQVAFKSCKLIPVLIGGILIQGKRCSMLEFLAAVLMSIGLTLFTLADRQLKSALEFCSQFPLETYGYGFVFSLSGYCGVNLVLSVVRHYGAFIAVVVTTCRKAVTIILSFIIFSKPFTMQYLWSGLIVVCGMYLNICSRSNKVYRVADLLNFWLSAMQHLCTSHMKKRKLQSQTFPV